MAANEDSAADDRAWDEIVDESFPASDPPANFTHAGPPQRRQPPSAGGRHPAPSETRVARHFLHG